jgi:opacity protein-like surface antigen
MIKKSLAIASLLALGTSAMAVNVQPYVGASLGASWNKVEGKYDISGPFVNESGKESERNSSFLVGIKGGVILDNSHRLGLNYNPAFHSNATVHNILASYDYLISVNDSNRFYVGAHAGYASLKGNSDLDGLDMSGFAYGAQVGYIYDITKNVEFEIGLNYTKHNADKSYSYTELGHNVNEKYELKDSISTLVGINYKF